MRIARLNDGPRQSGSRASQIVSGRVETHHAFLQKPSGLKIKKQNPEIGCRIFLCTLEHGLQIFLTAFWLSTMFVISTRD
jgi:hypothetical protein